MALVVVIAAGCSTPPAAVAHADTVTLPAFTVTTSYGSFTAVLFPGSAPRTVELMQSLANASYFDGRAFIRVIPGHVIQEADASGGQMDDSRRLPLEIDPTLHFAAGALGISRDASVNSGGPEFFVMDYATSHLDGAYTVFGQVVRGLDVVHRIARAPAIDAPIIPSTIPEIGGTMAGTTDRMAVPPVLISAATMGTITLGKAEWAHYPMQVARDVKHGSFRDSLEWPADLRAGRTSDLTWYVRTYNGTSAYAPPVTAVVDGATLATRVDADGAGAGGAGYAFTWTPNAAGNHTVVLKAGPTTVGTLVVNVPA